jgi:rhodanese-related sulfurtransferase
MTDIKRVSPQEALELTKDGWVYVDVRSEPEFEEGHPANSFNVPISHLVGGSMTPNPDFVGVMDRAFGREAKIIVGCKSGGRSLRAANALVAAGFKNVIDQRAGWDGTRDPFGAVGEAGWLRAGLPTEKGPTAGHAYAELRAKTAR